MHVNRVKVSGFLLTAGALEFLVFMLLAELLYPGYSVSGNYISDLGVGRTAVIFNSSIIVLGLLVISGGYFLFPFSKAGSVILMLAGLGAALVGVFPENTGEIHSLSALLVFSMGGIFPFAIILRLRSFYTAVYVLLGIVSLASLVLFATGHYLSLGAGGMERMIAIPELLMLLSFGTMLGGSSAHVQSSAVR